MGWLNSSAGSGFFSLCSATKVIVPCLRPVSDAVPHWLVMAIQARTPSHILSRFRPPHLEEGSSKICLHTWQIFQLKKIRAKIQRLASS